MPCSSPDMPARLAANSSLVPSLGIVLLAVKQFQKPSLFVFGWLICWGFSSSMSIFAKLFHGNLLKNAPAKMPAPVTDVLRPAVNATSDNKASPQGEDKI